MKSQDRRMETVHQIDSIYHGNLNSSYQKDGFGILQTLQFHTYIGYWKNNKTQGLGLAILDSGSIIYAYFNRDVIDGLAILDDGNFLLCGVFRVGQIVGVGFEYQYGSRVWRMSRYHKGVPIQVIREEASDIANGLPKMINVEQSIYFHLYAYVYRDYFPDLDIQVIDEPDQGRILYGLMNDYKKLSGPGILVEDHQVVEAGFYEDGILHGFGFKTSKNPTLYEFGCYHKGRKDGVFMEKDLSQARFIEYRKGVVLRSLPNSQSVLIKNQKKYNFNCKDFLSSKNSIPFEQYHRKNLKKQFLRDFNNKSPKTNTSKNNKLSPNNRLGMNQNLTNPNTTMRQKQESPKKTQKSNNKSKGTLNRSYIVGEKNQRSSVQIIREKMSSFYNIVSGIPRKKSKQSSPNKSLNNTNKNMESVNNDDEEIAKQENPFY